MSGTNRKSHHVDATYFKALKPWFFAFLHIHVLRISQFEESIPFTFLQEMIMKEFKFNSTVAFQRKKSNYIIDYSSIVMFGVTLKDLLCLIGETKIRIPFPIISKCFF